MKQCKECKISKAESKFYKFARNKDGLRHICKSCWPNTWVKQNPEKARKSYQKSKLKLKYGISQEQYNTMLLKQDGKCAICGTSRGLNVDHDHKTGLVRKLLCGKCNRGLGQFDDNSDICIAAYHYLKDHSAI